MSYRDFDLPTVQERFGVVTQYTQSLLADVEPLPISADMLEFVANMRELGLMSRTEKARAELLVAPLVGQVWLWSQRGIAICSGLEFDVNPARGLYGECHFLFSRAKHMLFIEAPVLAVVEVRSESIAEGLGQCAAEMIAARMFNEQKRKPIETIYGCVTTGLSWKFLRLSNQLQLDIDEDEYSINQPERIVGILLHCCGVTV
jgi:hypothetical protein